MKWRIIKQPNGKYARFSFLSNNFTHMNMSKAKVKTICNYYTDIKTVMSLIKAADSPVYNYSYYSWDSCINTMSISHGAKEIKKIKKIDKKG